MTCVSSRCSCRYTTRFLSRHLAERYFGSPLLAAEEFALPGEAGKVTTYQTPITANPESTELVVTVIYPVATTAAWVSYLSQTDTGVDAGHHQMADAVVRRINEAPGPYQMFSFLVDGISIESSPAAPDGGEGEEGGGAWVGRYHEDVPRDYFLERQKANKAALASVIWCAHRPAPALSPTTTMLAVYSAVHQVLYCAAAASDHLRALAGISSTTRSRSGWRRPWPRV